MGEIRIINLRNYTLKEGEILVKVDRSSILGNPYRLNSESVRDVVCDMYQNYFAEQVIYNNNFRNELVRIAIIAENHDVAFGCWCHPKRCHAETIKDYIMQISGRGGI